MMSSTSFTAIHVQIETLGPFEDVNAKFLRQLGKLDAAAVNKVFADRPTLEAVKARMAALAGPTELWLFATFDHGAPLALLGQKARVTQHLVGNPLIAAQMTRLDLRAALYAPLRVVIYEAGERVYLEYDLPSSLLGLLGNPQIDAIASDLDRKLADVIAIASTR